MLELSNGSLYEKALQLFHTVLKDTAILGYDNFFEKISTADGFSIRSYKSGEVIFTPASFERSLSFLLQGNAVATKNHTGRPVIIRRFYPHDIFGIAALFTEDKPYPSEIRVSSPKALIAFVPQKIVAAILAETPEASLAYIKLLSEKIRYLNSKLDAFTAPNAMTRLCLYLSENNGSNLSMQTLANMLNISRMTLYRILDELTARGAIAKAGKAICLLDKEKLFFSPQDGER